MSVRQTEFRTPNDVQLQARLERMLAARRAEELAREERYRRLPTPRSRFRANAKAPVRDLRPGLPSKPVPEPFTWVDAGVFLIPLGVVAALILLAHWFGWMP